MNYNRGAGTPRGRRDRGGRSDSLAEPAAQSVVAPASNRGRDVSEPAHLLQRRHRRLVGVPGMDGLGYLLSRGEGGGRLGVALSCAIVGGTIGTGLNLVAGMANAQWKQQIKRIVPGFLAGGLGGGIGGFWATSSSPRSACRPRWAG